MHTFQGTKKRAGFTLPEIMVAATIGLLVTGLAVYLTMFVARSQGVLVPQATRQATAGRSLQSVTNFIRNGQKLDPTNSNLFGIKIYQGNTEITALDTPGNRVDFRVPENMPTGTVSSIRYANGALTFYPDTTSNSNTRVLARNLTAVSFSRQNPQNEGLTYELSAQFNYLKFKGRSYSEAKALAAGTGLNGLFTTQIVPRN